LNYNSKQLNRLNVCCNNAYRSIFRTNVRESVKELQLLCERLNFKHYIGYILKKILVFLHKLKRVRINNKVLKAGYDMFSHSVEFTLLCHSFDRSIALDLCSEVDIRSKVFSAINHTVHRLLSATQVASVFLLYFSSTVFYLTCLSAAYGE